MNPLFSSIERATLVGFVALAVALLLQWLLSSRAPASWRVWIWRVALIQSALALVPLAPIALAVLPAPTPIAAPAPSLGEAPAPLQTSAVTEAPVAPTSVAEALPAPVVTASPQTLAAAPTWSEAPRAPAFDWRLWLVAIYACGIGVQLALLARNARRVRRVLRACTPLDDAPLRAGLLRAVAARLDIAKTPRLLQSEGDAPFLVGLVRPTIVVPRALKSGHLEAVFAHELAHLKRRDLAWNALLWALQTALWFHPLTFAARRFHALEVESACDELTLQLTQIAPKSYGALLITSMNKHSSPLTAGVHDGFFALQTRLKRLGRAPKSPRRRVRWLFGLALLISFVAVVPLRLVSRAQTEAKTAKPTAPAPTRYETAQRHDVSGTVVDAAGRPVAGATVYAVVPMLPRETPYQNVKSDSKGHFVLRDAKRGDFDMSVFADAGTRGRGESDLYGQSVKTTVRLTPSARAVIRFVDSNGRAVPDLRVRLRSLGSSTTAWRKVPRAVLKSLQTTTDARGEATFAGLPLGDVAQFGLADQIAKPTKFGMGDLRGTRFAPLATEDAVALKAETARKTIALLQPIRLQGQVSLPDGGAKGNVLILARRINAAEAAGNDEKREQLIAQTRSNATGQYVMDGLRPGRYYVWVYPEKQLVKEFAGDVYIRDLQAPVNRVNFRLSRGAIVQGVVISKATKKPVKGQTMWLFDSQENNQYTITDARGYFKFRALGGKQRLRVHENGSNSPPPGFVLPAQSEFNFTVKNGEKREFRIEMPGTAVDSPTRGVVVNKDDQPVAGANVTYRVLGKGGVDLKTIVTDQAGRFVLPLKDSDKPAQLFADAGERATPGSSLALRGGKVTLRLADDAWAKLEGRVLDENKKPVSGAKVTLHMLLGNNGIEPRTTRSDADGRYRFARLRPGTGAMLGAIKDGYSLGGDNIQQVAAAQMLTRDLVVKRAPQSVSGVVLGGDGKPARGFYVWGDGQNKSIKTRDDGKFYLPQVFAGPIDIQVSAPGGGRQWRDFKATGGDTNLVLRLSDKNLDTRFTSSAPRTSPAPLVGQSAPAIQAARWANNKAVVLSSLRGQNVLLVFDRFGFRSADGTSGLARALQGRAQVIGIQLGMEDVRNGRNFDIDALARELGFPIAADAELPTKQLSGWRTFSAYNNAPYVVIGRDGKVRYAGDKLDRAVASATADN